MAKELLEKIPLEKRWAITAKFLGTFAVLRGEKRVATAMGKEEGIISPLLSVEKWNEVNRKAWGEEGGRKQAPWVIETFNIPVEDAIGAARFMSFVTVISCGPEWESEIVEKSKDKSIVRTTKCPWWNRHKELDADPDIASCYPPHEAWIKSGLKAINPKIIHKLTKAMPRGDPYCEDVFEFQDE
jgi:hypothetical protein